MIIATCVSGAVDALASDGTLGSLEQTYLAEAGAPFLEVVDSDTADSADAGRTARRSVQRTDRLGLHPAVSRAHRARRGAVARLEQDEVKTTVLRRRTAPDHVPGDPDAFGTTVKIS